MRLELGTVQFGMNYGISNSCGQTKTSEVQSILDFAFESGVTILDSADKYGNCHAVLGQTRSLNKFKIITKLGLVDSAVGIKTNITNILDDLKLESISGLMFHSVGDFAKAGEEGFRELINAKKDKIVQKIGVSVYNADEVDWVLDSFDVDIIQLPLGIFNQENFQSGTLKKLKEKNIEIHVRSIFLQGVPFMDPGNIPTALGPIVEKVKLFKCECEKIGLTPVEMCYAYIKSIREVDYVIIGVNNTRQLELSVRAFNKDYSNIEIDFNKFNIESREFSEPRNWKL